MPASIASRSAGGTGRVILAPLRIEQTDNWELSEVLGTAATGIPKLQTNSPAITVCAPSRMAGLVRFSTKLCAGSDLPLGGRPAHRLVSPGQSRDG